jgi:O-methyltransferase domain/Dimerisation domain
MFSMLSGSWVAQVLRAAAIFSIAEHMAEGLTTAAEIAVAESTDPDATRRFLRTCASLGLLTSADGEHYQGTALLDTLRRDAPDSLWGWARMQGEPGCWLPWGRFPDAVRTGEPQVITTLGMTTFDYYVNTAEEGRYFTIAMDNLSTEVVGEVARVLDTRQATLAVDLGGASGSLVRCLMQANPRLRGMVLDRPDVVPDAVAAADAMGLGDRFTGQAGDFFAAVPPADLYLLKYILHDWDDEQCVRLLRNCRQSLTETGRVVVVELLVGQPGEPGVAPLMDMGMLVLQTGRERELGEYDRLFTAAGLRMVRVQPTRSPFVVLEAVPR